MGVNMDADVHDAGKGEEIPATVVPSAELRGRRFLSPECVIDAASLRAFEAGTWLDRVYTEADDYPDAFPQEMVPGFMTLALIDAIGAMTRRYEPTDWHVLNYGLDRVRFVRPVAVDDMVRVSFTVAAVETVDGGSFRITEDVEMRRGDEVIARVILLAVPRRSGSGAL
jgi:MaoC like domain